MKNFTLLDREKKGMEGLKEYKETNEEKIQEKKDEFALLKQELIGMCIGTKLEDTKIEKEISAITGERPADYIRLLALKSRLKFLRLNLSKGLN